MKLIATNFYFSIGRFFVPFVLLIILGVQDVRATSTDNYLISHSDKTNCNCDVVFSQYTELMSIYNALDGSNWTIKWDLNLPASTWHGVTFDEQCHIVEIALVNNNLKGVVPNVDFPNLTFFDLRNNQLSGTLPNFSLPKVEILNVDNNNLQGTVPTFSNCPDLFILGISDNNFDECPDLSAHSALIKIIANSNKFTFEDIIPNEADMDDAYSPQQHLSASADVTLQEGSSHTITIPTFDEAISTNIYEWFKDGTSVGVGNGQSLTLTNVSPSDAGDYTLKVSNPTAPDLTLSSNMITITVIVMSGTGICDQDDLIIPTTSQNTYHAKQTLTSTATISSATTFKAGTSITLQPGFHVINGTDFLATIQNCGNVLQETPTTFSKAKVAPSTRLETTHQLMVYPNPFSHTATISYQLPATSSIHLQILDMLGRQVAVLAYGTIQQAGQHQISYQPTRVKEGLILFYCEVIRIER